MSLAAADAGEWFDTTCLLTAALADEYGAQVWSFDAEFVRLAELGLVRLYDGLADEAWRPGG